MIIVGTGAGGGTLAWRLAPSGKRILLLERGGFLARERDNWDSTAVFIRAKYRARETWFDDRGNAFHPGIHYYVGGNTKFYGAQLFRLREADFGELRHHGGLSLPGHCPTPTSRRTTPKPSGPTTSTVCEARTPRNPQLTSRFRSPVSHEPRIQQLSDDLKRLGCHPFHGPLGVLLEQDAEGRARRDSPCIRCDRFDAFSCLVHAKADAEGVCVEPALRHPNVQLLTEAYVDRLSTTPQDGRWSACTWCGIWKWWRAALTLPTITLFRGRVVESARLLESAAGDRRPESRSGHRRRSAQAQRANPGTPCRPLGGVDLSSPC